MQLTTETLLPTGTVRGMAAGNDAARLHGSDSGTEIFITVSISHALIALHPCLSDGGRDKNESWEKKERRKMFNIKTLNYKIKM